MAASVQCVISTEISPPPPSSKSSQTQSVHSPSLHESVTDYTDDEANPADATPEIFDTGISIDYSPMNCNGYTSDGNSAPSQSPSHSKSNSISFPFEESQIGQFYMKQEAAKKSNKYRIYPTCSRRFDLPPKLSDDNDDKNDDNDEIMDRILTNYRRQESSSKDIRRFIRKNDIVSRNVFASFKHKRKSHRLSAITSKNTRAKKVETVHPIAKSADFSESNFTAQSEVPLQTRIAQWREMTEKEDPTFLSKIPTNIIKPKMQHFDSGPVLSEHVDDMMIESMTPQLSRGRSTALSPKYTGPGISSLGFCEPEIFSDDDIQLDAYFDSDGEDNDNQDSKEEEDSLEAGRMKLDQKQAQLTIRRTAQLLMVSNEHSKDVFQSLWKICISLKKDPTYHIPFCDKLLNYDHVESYLQLLGFLKNKSSSRWSCFAHTRIEISLIDYAILECHKCLHIVQQRGTTIDLVNKHKLDEQISDTSQRLKLNLLAKPLSIVQQSQSVSHSIEESLFYSIDENERDNGDCVQLYELIWGITHNNNNDAGAKDVLLLCYPLVTNARYILYCLQARFFKDDHDGRKTLDSISNTSYGDNMKTHVPQNSSIDFGSDKSKYDKILSSFSVQENVIALIRHWMVRFWDKDWDSNRKLMRFCKVFMKRIRKAYQSEENKECYEPLEIQNGLHLVEMLEQTIKTQKSHTQMRISKLLGPESENCGSSSGYGDNGGTTRHKTSSSLFFRGFSSRKRNKGPKDLTEVNYVIIAEQITLLKFNLFKKIHPRECLKQAWKNKETKHKKAPNITQYIEAFNHLTKWIQSSILAVHGVKSRGATILKWVRVEEELLKLRNFQGLCSVHCGLASTPIFRLKEAWSYVPKKHITQHEEIHVIMKSSGNWRNLRSLQLQTHPPMLPYFGMFAQDMIGIEETTNNRSNDGSINWDALCRGQAAINKHLIYQDSPYNNLNTDLSIQRWINKELRMSGKLDNEYIYQVSDNVLLDDKRELGKDYKRKRSLWKSK